MTFVTAHPEKAVLEAAALQEGIEFPVDMLGQGFALLRQLGHEDGIVCFDELVEQGLLGLMAFVGSADKALPTR